MLGSIINRTKEKTTSEMMKKFNELNESYNKMAENSLTNKEHSYEYLSKPDDPNLENIIMKMNMEYKYAISEINVLQEELSRLKSYEKKYNKILECLRECNSLQNEFISDPKIRELNNEINDINIVKFDSSENLDFLNKLMTNINYKISENEQKMSKLLSTVSSFRKFLLRTSEINANKLTCTICYSNKISHCLNPCGHTFCKSCIDRMGRSCSSCRTGFQSQIKMFITENENEEDDLLSNNTSDFSINSSISGIDSNITSSHATSSILNNFSNSDFYSWMPLS